MSSCSWDCVRLVAFDVDGTLVEHDGSLVIWQLLHQRFVGDDEVNRLRYRDYLDGRLSYAEWVRLDVEGWRDGGATRASIEQVIREHLRLVPGAREVIGELHRRGYTLAIVSGTLDLVLDVLFPDHPFHHVFTNRISFDDAGAIAGWQATPFDMDGKAEALRALALQLGIAHHQIAFVGDHTNDCSALKLVGCPVAYDPKHDSVRALARTVLPRGGLRGLLDLLPARAPAAH
ncbi:MAG TPA: HAD family phosphatase [Polyangiaceae bacterium]|nr:HAD family phosphatase [Polyangiaceae bacterium]